MKYYVDQEGKYLGGWDQNPPQGAVEVPYPPPDARQGWTGEDWGAVAATPETIAARRYQAETGGIVVSDMPVKTDRESQALFTGAALAAKIAADAGESYSVNWKTGAGFVTLDGATILAVAQAVRAHVQACFDVEAVKLAALTAGEPVDLEDGWP